MAILAIFTSKHITIDHYEALRKDVAWESQKPPGAMFHVCGFDDEGFLRVVDVWASPGEMEKFFAERLGPALEKMGLPAPSVEVLPAHNINAYQTLDKHLLAR